MPREKTKVSSVLVKKGFSLDDKRDHRYFYLYDSDGKRTTVYTKISRGSGKEISDGLLGEMMRQIHLGKKEFNKYMDCTLSKEMYLDHLKQIGKYH